MEVQIKNIQKKYRKKSVLKDINLEASGGTCIGILGCNGSGKSTLLSILAGVLRRDGGNFLCDGKDLFHDQALRAQMVGYVPQGTPLIEELSAKDNLLLWYSPEQMKQELENGVLKMLGIDAFLKVPVNKMSGGMKKRLSIGCSVANRPPILLLDEPTAALDGCSRDYVIAFLMEQQKKGKTIVAVSHDYSFAAQCSVTIQLG